MLIVSIAFSNRIRLKKKQVLFFFYMFYYFSVIYQFYDIEIIMINNSIFLKLFE